MASQFNAAVIYRTLQLFLDQDLVRRPTSDIAKQVTEEFNLQPRITREQVYKIIAQARSEGVMSLHPPRDQQLQQELDKKFPECFRKFVVVTTTGRTDNAKVAEVAADYAMDIVRDFGRKRPDSVVGLGLGPGRATLDFCRHFSRRVNTDSFFPKLRLIAISAGCPAKSPDYASSSFFHLFADDKVKEKIGLFAETRVRVRDFPRVKTISGVREAFEASNQIDVVVTSMGDFSDDHDLLTQFLSDAGMTASKLIARKWVGNVQYRPYSASGPVTESPNDWRAVTVFEIPDLVRMANLDNKHVILIARQCGKCGATRAKPLLPLIKNSNLRVFSKLVMDEATARELVKISG